MNDPMNVHLCGLWDGANLWLQWDDVWPDAGYLIRLRLRTAGQAWGDWMAIEHHRPYPRNWIVIPCGNKQGWEAQAAVSVALAGEEWVPCQEVTFLQSRCLFAFLSTRRPILYARGSVFHAVVDSAACHYALLEDLQLETGVPVQATMVSASTSGYAQLDYPGHFNLSGATLGLTIQNVEPSVEDVQPTGRDFTALAPLVRKEPLRLVLGSRPNLFLGLRNV